MGASGSSTGKSEVEVFRYPQYLVSVLALITCTGCPALMAGLGSGSTAPATSAAGTVTAATAIVPSTSVSEEVEGSSHLGLLSPAAVLDGSYRLEADIIEEQCEFRTPDPPFLVPADVAQNGWTFAGRLDTGQQLHQMQALEYRSLLGFGWSKQQLNTWPVSMATLSQMPRLYLEEEFGFLAKAKLDKNQRNRLTREAIADSAKIQETVKRLEKTYNPEIECVDGQER